MLKADIWRITKVSTSLVSVLQGRGELQQQAAKVAASCSYHLLMEHSKASEGDAAAWLVKLDMALAKASGDAAEVGV